MDKVRFIFIMTSKKDQTSSKKDSNKQGKQPNDSPEDIAMLIKRAMAAEMETFQETVALMLNEIARKSSGSYTKTHGRERQHSPVVKRAG